MAENEPEAKPVVSFEASLDELEKVSHAETQKIEALSALKEKEVMEIK